MPSREGLVLDRVTKAYGSRELISDATLMVAPGEVVCLTGDNGAGKSTLLRMLVGLAGFGGQATFDHLPVGSAEYLSRVGYVPQAPMLVENATVGETISFFAELRGVDFEQDALPAGFLPPLEDKIEHLSGGQRQRVALAVAFLGGPDLLLLDEPTANLDDRGRWMVKEMIRAAADAGAAVVIVSPAAIDLVGMVDRILVLRDGIVSPDERLIDELHRATTRPDASMVEVA